MLRKRPFGRAKETQVAMVSSSSRDAGDRSRDAGNWLEAVQYYQAYLDTNATDDAIWIQLGNCLKEAGQVNQAVAAYDRAIALAPNDADVHLQKGHALKVGYRLQEALASYERSVVLAPLDNPASLEVLLLNKESGKLAAGVRRKTDDTLPSLYLDFSDLIIYLEHNDSLSGIQRVVANLLKYLPSIADRGKVNVIPVLPDYMGLSVYAVETSLAQALIEMLEKGHKRDEIRSAISGIRESRKRVEPKRGDSFLIAGAFWIYHRYDLLNQLQRSGISVVVYIHDLIQITDPEYVAKDATSLFWRSLTDILSVSSQILTNSNYVKGEVQRFVRERLNFDLPVQAVTLATELGNVKSDEGQHRSELSQILKNRYVLYVSTIEVRKNHIFTIKMWERLASEGVDIPHLVFVGKWGWQVDELRRYLDASDYLNGRLHILNTVSDRELAALYRDCYFSVYASFAEGWGLPVGESLAYGKPCFASNATSIPEVGGSLCEYFSPVDLEGAATRLKAILQDPAFVDDWAERVRREFKLKTWSDFATELFVAVTSSPGSLLEALPRTNCLLEENVVAPFGHGAVFQLAASGQRLITARMSRVYGWHNIEHWGCWAAWRHAGLCFRTVLPPGTPVSIKLQLSGPDDSTSSECTVSAGRGDRLLVGLGSWSRWFVVPGVVAEDQTITVEFVSGRGFSRTYDGVERYVGIVAVAYEAADVALEAPAGVTSKTVPMTAEVV